MSSSTHSKRSVLWVAAALAALVALPAIAQSAPPPQVAAISVNPGSVTWTPQVSFAKLVLTVAGGGHTQTFEFEGGSPFFAPVDEKGYALPDGIYTWELTVIPTALSLNESHFRSAQPSADGRSHKAAEYPPGLTQFGAFTISGGALVNPDLVETPGVGGDAAAAPEAAGARVDDSDQ